MTHSDYQAFIARRMAQSGPSATVFGELAVKETKLHQDIIAWCDSQWPRWKYIHARTDARSTIGVGVADFTIFGPHPLCILVECKTKTGKQSPEQLAWAAEMKALGWTVHVCRSMEQFLEITKA